MQISVNALQSAAPEQDGMVEIVMMYPDLKIGGVLPPDDADKVADAIKAQAEIARRKPSQLYIAGVDQQAIRDQVMRQNGQQ